MKKGLLGRKRQCKTRMRRARGPKTSELKQHETQKALGEVAGCDEAGCTKVYENIGEVTCGGGMTEVLNESCRKAWRRILRVTRFALEQRW